MKRTLLSSAILLCTILTAAGQPVEAGLARFHVGDDPAWRAPQFDDSAWQVLSLDKTWDDQGIKNAYNYAWYRIRVVIPASLKKGVSDKVLLDLGPIDDTDETWLNGHFVGKTGTNPEDPEGYDSQWSVPRRYIVDAKWIRWDAENVIAVRVYNSGNPGGFFERPVRIGKPELSDFLTLSLKGTKDACQLELRSSIKTAGTLEVSISEPAEGDIAGILQEQEPVVKKVLSILQNLIFIYLHFQVM